MALWIIVYVYRYCKHYREDTTCVCMCVCVRVRMCVHVRAHVCMCVHIRVYVGVCVRECCNYCRCMGMKIWNESLSLQSDNGHTHIATLAGIRHVVVVFIVQGFHDFLQHKGKSH